MKNKIPMTLLLLHTFLPLTSLAQEQTEIDTTAPLTEEAQTLEAPAAAQTVEETKTEVLPVNTENQEIQAEVSTETSPEPTTAETPKKKLSPVVSDEEILKVSDEFKKSREDKLKIKSVKLTESELFMQEADKFKLTENFKNLKLNDVIEQGLRKNYSQDILKSKEELNELEFQGVKDAFWMPDLKITLTSSEQNISTLRKSSRTPTTPNPLTPTGSLGLNLGNYTVFNWGKDYALYLNKKSTYNRKKEIFNENKRELKLTLIENFFELVAKKEIEKIRKDELRHASFVYRLNKEKISVGKTSKQDYYQTRSEYLRAQNDFHNSKIDADQADESIAYFIADEIGTKYVLSEILDYKRIKISLEDALSQAQKNNPSMLNSKTTVENAERSYDVALKENMPLPKFTVNLGGYKKQFGPTTNSTHYETYSNSGNVELVASVNASWALTGEDGLFNSNKLAKSHLAKEIAFKELQLNQQQSKSLIRSTYKTILSLQNQIMILEARIPSLQKTFDTILENYLSNKAKYYDFHIILDELISTRILFEQTKLNHLKEKIKLAKYAGLEDFPGENFEYLAQRAKGK